MADGSINFDTKVDDSGVEKLSTTIKKNIAEIEREINKLNKRIESKEFNLIGNESEASIRKISAQLDALEAKRDELMAEKSNQENLLNIELGKEKAEADLNSMCDAFENFRAKLAYGILGISKGVLNGIGTAFKTVGSIIGKVTKTVTKAIGGIAKKLSEWRKNNMSVTASAKSIVKQFTRLSTMLKARVLRAFSNEIMNAVQAGIQDLAKISPSFNGAISSMKSNLATLGGSFVSAFAPIVEYVTPIINSLVAHLNTAVQALGNFFAVLTGKTVTTKAVKVQKDYANSLKDTGSSAKGAEKALASFDEINQLRLENTSSGGGGAGSDVGFETVETKSSELADLLKNGEFLEAGTYLADLINKQIDSIDFEGIGTRLGEGLQHAIEFSFGFISEIDTYAISEGIAQLLNNGMYAIDFYMLGQTLAEMLNRIVDLALGFAKTFDFSAFGLGIAEGINGAIHNFDIVSFVDGLDAWVVGIWNSLVALLGNIDYAEFFKKIGAGLARMVFNVKEWEVWSLIGDYFDEKSDECGGNLILGILKGIVDGLKAIGQWLYDNVFKPIWDGICEVFEIHSPSKAMERIGNFIVEGMLNGISNTWQSIVGFFASNFPGLSSLVTSQITNIISTIKGILRGLISFVSGVFRGDWGQAWEGVKSIFKSVWNGIVSLCQNAVNFIVDCLNKLSFDIPSWVPMVGGSHFGLNLHHISIPRLATGTVVPNNSGEFLAMLGDNKRETEVVSPLSTMKEALSEALAEYGGNQNVNIRFDGSLSELARILKPAIEKEDKRVGKSLVSSGA